MMRRRNQVFLALFAEIVASMAVGCSGRVDEASAGTDAASDTARADTAIAIDTAVAEDTRADTTIDETDDDTGVDSALDTTSDTGADTCALMPCGCYKPPPPTTIYVVKACDEYDAMGECIAPLNCSTECGPNPSGYGPYSPAMCRWTKAPTGASQIECTWFPPPCGRRTEGQPELDGTQPAAVGAWLATAAYLEAGSIDAFLRLASELEEHGAPDRLISAARRAAADEVRHARDVAKLSRRFAAEPSRPARVKPRRRTLARIAEENAREGCVREMFGALVATHQAKAANDPEVRALFAKIAEEETQHAALSWEIAAWAESRLSPSTRARISRARRAEIAKVQAELAAEPSPELARTLGLPRAREAQGMFAAMVRALPSV